MKLGSSETMQALGGLSPVFRIIGSVLNLLHFLMYVVDPKVLFFKGLLIITAVEFHLTMDGNSISLGPKLSCLSNGDPQAAKVTEEACNAIYHNQDYWVGNLESGEEMKYRHFRRKNGYHYNKQKTFPSVPETKVSYDTFFGSVNFEASNLTVKSSPEYLKQINRYCIITAIVVAAPLLLLAFSSIDIYFILEKVRSKEVCTEETGKDSAEEKATIILTILSDLIQYSPNRMTNRLWVYHVTSFVTFTGLGLYHTTLTQSPLPFINHYIEPYCLENNLLLLPLASFQHSLLYFLQTKLNLKTATKIDTAFACNLGKFGASGSLVTSSNLCYNLNSHLLTATMSIIGWLMFLNLVVHLWALIEFFIEQSSECYRRGKMQNMVPKEHHPRLIEFYTNLGVGGYYHFSAMMRICSDKVRHLILEDLDKRDNPNNKL